MQTGAFRLETSLPQVRELVESFEFDAEGVLENSSKAITGPSLLCRPPRECVEESDAALSRARSKGG